jgi:hypothetical protein
MAKKPAKKKAAKKAHDEKGQFVADDPSTPENEHLAGAALEADVVRREAQRSVGLRRLGGKVIPRG